jgi:hypothetical protein
MIANTLTQPFDDALKNFRYRSTADIQAIPLLIVNFLSIADIRSQLVIGKADAQINAKLSGGQCVATFTQQCRRRSQKSAEYWMSE